MKLAQVGVKSKWFRRNHMLYPPCWWNFSQNYLLFMWLLWGEEQGRKQNKSIYDLSVVYVCELFGKLSCYSAFLWKRFIIINWERSHPINIELYQRKPLVLALTKIILKVESSSPKDVDEAFEVWNTWQLQSVSKVGANVGTAPHKRRL